MSQFINSMNVYFIQPVLKIYFHAPVYFNILNIYVDIPDTWLCFTVPLWIVSTQLRPNCYIR